MASFFGELRPLSSRAVDDEEADDQPKYTVFIENTEAKNKIASSSHFIIFSIGEIATAFVESNFLFDNSALISTLRYTSEVKDESSFYTDMLKRSASKNIFASVYESNSRVLVCKMPCPIPEEICFEATEMIFRNFSPSKVLILTSRHMATYRHESSLLCEKPFLKSLASSQYLADYTCNISRLSPPNFLSNMPASLLLKCEAAKIPALCVINYVDTHMIDSFSIEMFNHILSEPVLLTVVVNNNAQERVQKYIKTKLPLESNLYT